MLTYSYINNSAIIIILQKQMNVQEILCTQTEPVCTFASTDVLDKNGGMRLAVDHKMVLLSKKMQAFKSYL